MNEQIKQLLGQAYDQAVPETWTTLSSEQLGRVYEKFAELIIKECINTLETRRKTSKASPGEYGNGFKSGIAASARCLQVHFGVEE